MWYRSSSEGIIFLLQPRINVSHFGGLVGYFYLFPDTLTQVSFLVDEVNLIWLGWMTQGLVQGQRCIGPGSLTRYCDHLWSLVEGVHTLPFFVLWPYVVRQRRNKYGLSIMPCFDDVLERTLTIGLHSGGRLDEWHVYSFASYPLNPLNGPVTLLVIKGGVS